MLSLNRIATGGAALASITFACGAHAQSVIVPPPSVSTIPPAFQSGAGDPLANEADAQFLGWLPKGLPFSYGPVTFRPHLSYSVQYGDGISASAGNQEESWVHQIAPGILINIGNKWVLDYTPTLRYYSSDAFEDGLDHSVSFSGGTSYEDWLFGFSQGYTSSSTPLIETGTQTETESFNTGLSATWLLNSKSSLDFSLSQNFNFAEGGYNSYKQWSTSDFYNYKFWPKFTGGFGVTVGYVDVEQGSDMTFEQPTLRLSYTPAEKMTFDVHVGFEVRQFLDSSIDALINPIYGASIGYSPFEHTRLALSIDRSVNTSYFNNQITEGTSISASLNQRLLGHLMLGLSGGFSKSDYVATEEGLNVSRGDDRFFFSARLSTAFLKRGTLGVFYNYSNNDSNQGAYNYDSTMIGADISWRY